MNILIVVQNYLPFIGGVETHARQIAHEFVRRGHQVSIAAANFAPSKRPARTAVLNASLLAPSYDDYQDGPIPVTALTPRGRGDRVRMLPIALRTVPKLQRVAYHSLHRLGYPSYRSVYLPRLRKLVAQADVVHALSNDYIGWTAQAAAREKGIPFIVTPFVHPHQWGDGPNDVAFYKESDTVIGLVDTDSDYLHTLGVPQDQIRTIGVSPDLLPQADPEGFRKKHGLEGVPFVLYVGRMMPQKGASAVIASTPEVWERHPEARFIFIGPANPAEAAVFEGADRRIQYLGKVSAQEKADALAACDVFCMPSMSEILPTVYLEAWSYAKPVVGGRAHGLPELVEGNGGGFAVSQEASEVAVALGRLLADPDLRIRMGQVGQDLVGRKYTVEAVSGTLERLYKELIERNAAPAKAKSHEKAVRG